jgi:hypothetical protein
MEQKANSRNSVLNHSTEEKTTQNYVPWNKKRSKHFREFRSEEQNRSKLSEFCSEGFSNENILFAGAGFFV